MEQFEQLSIYLIDLNPWMLLLIMRIHWIIKGLFTNSRIWFSHDLHRRDFRSLSVNSSDPYGPPVIHPVFWFDTPFTIEVFRIFWKSFLLIEFKSSTNTSITYSLTMKSPLNGWIEFYLEMDFLGSSGSVLQLTTEIVILPNFYPIPDCHDEQCFGTLV